MYHGICVTSSVVEKNDWEAEANHGRALQGIFWFGLYRQGTGYGEEPPPIHKVPDVFFLSEFIGKTNPSCKKSGKGWKGNERYSYMCKLR